MERTRNSLLQQRAHLRCWLDRGSIGVSNVGAGHIRWGKAIKGLVGKLGELTAHHAGAAEGRGHLIRSEVTGVQRATGYVTSPGHPLDPEVVVSNKANLRREMSLALRAFGGATRIIERRWSDHVLGACPPGCRISLMSLEIAFPKARAQRAWRFR